MADTSSNAGEGFVKQRLRSLDAYRGLIMVTLAFSGFGLAETAAKHLEASPDSWFWRALRYQFDHVEWVGCAYWDLIQPSFMFMVGLSMAYSYARRAREGASWERMLGHAVWRAFVLVALGIFLISNWGESTNRSLMNVLTQMGLGYAFLFLLWRRSPLAQGVAAAAILVATWLLYMLWPGTGVDISTGAPEVGVAADWAREHLTGVGAAWHKNANAGHDIDLWLLNLLPQKEAFTYNRGGYQTINFVPSLATMTFGLMAGELLRSETTTRAKMRRLVIGGLAGLAVGLALHWSGICPIVKRIWTPAWTLYSTGWCCLILVGLYAVIDVLGARAWSFPLVVVGMNSIAIYCMGMLLKPWVAKTLRIHLGQGEDVFSWLGRANEPFLRANMIGLVFWLVCWWMYRQRIFVRI